MNALGIRENWLKNKGDIHTKCPIRLLFTSLDYKTRCQIKVETLSLDKNDKICQLSNLDINQY